MPTAKLAILAVMSVALFAVGAWLHINDEDGTGVAIIGFITWIIVLLSI